MYVANIHIVSCGKLYARKSDIHQKAQNTLIIWSAVKIHNHECENSFCQ